MNSVLYIILPLALLSVVLVLVLGLWNMLRDGPGNMSQRLMRWRVILQFVAVILVMVALYVTNR